MALDDCIKFNQWRYTTFGLHEVLKRCHVETSMGIKRDWALEKKNGLSVVYDIQNLRERLHDQDTRS